MHLLMGSMNSFEMHKCMNNPLGVFIYGTVTKLANKSVSWKTHTQEWKFIIKFHVAFKCPGESRANKFLKLGIAAFGQDDDAVVVGENVKTLTEFKRCANLIYDQNLNFSSLSQIFSDLENQGKFKVMSDLIFKVPKTQ